MGTFRKSFSLAIAATNENILSGTDMEFPEVPTKVTIAAASDQTDVSMGVQFGTRVQAREVDTFAPKEPAAGVGPNVPDQVVLSEIALPRERIIISLKGGAAASVSRVLVSTTPLA